MRIVKDWSQALAGDLLQETNYVREKEAWTEMKPGAWKYGEKYNQEQGQIHENGQKVGLTRMGSKARGEMTTLNATKEAHVGQEWVVSGVSKIKIMIVGGQNHSRKNIY